jgi:N-methylhydantoinase A/oxoprolinase/acetone carboxylase beta subunit
MPARGKSLSKPASERPIRIAVDIGGTFTDLHVFDARTNQLHGWKTATTPADPSRGLMQGLREASDRFGFALADVGLLMHGTTVATNAVLERKLARGLLVTTEGFEDVLEIKRHVRRDIYGLQPEPAPTLIPRDRRLGIRERLRADGSIEIPLDEGALPRLLNQIDAHKAETIAICLLHSYVNPAHERRLGELIRAERPALPVSLSCEISPEIREFERCSTVVLNALLVPVVKAYLERLESLLGVDGFQPRVLLVQSNGGVCRLATAAAEPARLLLSGPSGGTLASARLAEILSKPNLVAADMGGTSFDISVVQNGRVTVVSQGEIGRLPVRLSMVEMRTIGSGGGSLAAVDSSGRLTVGPRSAGATPGPVAYGRGGTEPTVTDANLVLGRLDSRYFLGGRMALDTQGAVSAIESRVARPLGLPTEQAAQGILRLTNAGLGAAIRLSLFEKGLDPRDFVLLSFGGAAGLHATEVAAEVGMDEVLLPREPGTLSAFGIMFSDLSHHLVRSRLVRAEAANMEILAASVDDLRQAADASLNEDHVPADRRAVSISADLRYTGQAFELSVPWDSLAAFHSAHRQRFSYANPQDAVEIVALRAVATGLLPKHQPTFAHRPDLRLARKAKRRVFVGDDWSDVPVWDRDAIGPEELIEGPAVIEEAFATHWVAAGWTCALGEAGALVARRVR